MIVLVSFGQEPSQYLMLKERLIMFEYSENKEDRQIALEYKKDLEQGIYGSKVLWNILMLFFVLYFILEIFILKKITDYGFYEYFVILIILVILASYFRNIRLSYLMQQDVMRTYEIDLDALTLKKDHKEYQIEKIIQYKNNFLIFL